MLHPTQYEILLSFSSGLSGYILYEVFLSKEVPTWKMLDDNGCSIRSMVLYFFHLPCTSMHHWNRFWSVKTCEARSDLSRMTSQSVSNLRQTRLKWRWKAGPRAVSLSRSQRSFQVCQVFWYVLMFSSQFSNPSCQVTNLDFPSNVCYWLPLIAIGLLPIVFWSILS